MVHRYCGHGKNRQIEPRKFYGATSGQEGGGKARKESEESYEEDDEVAIAKQCGTRGRWVLVVW
jgi:hypothetical protein